MWGTIIAGALGLAGQLYGGYTASQAMKRVKANVGKQQQDNQDWYDKRYNEDATQRADAQRILNYTSEQIKQRNRAAAGTAAVMGGTEESVAATKEANAKAMADAVGRITVAGEQRREAIEQQYLERKANLENQLNDFERQKAAGVSQAAQGFAQAAGNAGAAYDKYLLDQQKIDKGIE